MPSFFGFIGSPTEERFSGRQGEKKDAGVKRTIVTDTGILRWGSTKVNIDFRRIPIHREAAQGFRNLLLIVLRV
jgi:hypothetical protein